MATISSTYSSTSTTTLLSDDWRLDDPLDLLDGLAVSVAPGFGLQRDTPQTEFMPAAAGALPVVVSGGTRGWRGTLTVHVLDAATYATLLALHDAGRALLLRDNLGRRWYVRLGAQSTWAILRAAPTALEISPIRHAHDVAVPWVEVATP